MAETSRKNAAVAVCTALVCITIAGGGAMLLRAQGLNDLTPQLPVSDPTCPFSGKTGRGA